MKTRIALTLTTLSLVLISACSKQERVREIDWAKAALARNPTVEIISTDETAGVFTVRDTSTGTTHKLRLEDLVAGPPPPKVAAQPAAPAAPEAPAAEPAATPGEEALPQTTETVAAVRSGGGASLAEGPGYSISRGGNPLRRRTHSKVPATASRVMNRCGNPMHGRARPMPKPWPPMSKNVPTPFAARAIG